MPGKMIIGETSIPYAERKSKRSTRITLRVTPEMLRISAPAKASKSDIQAFIASNQQWILDNWLKLQAQMPKPGQRIYGEGSGIPYLGQEVTLALAESKKGEISARYEKEKQVLKINLPEDLAGESRQEKIRMILEKWYKMRARAVFTEKLAYWSESMGVAYHQFRLKEQRTRWGSCSSLGNINLNWRAVMAPVAVIDYLVIHELAHLKHMNHSVAYWEFVAGFCREHQEHRRWLRQQGKNLIL